MIWIYWYASLLINYKTRLYTNSYVNKIAKGLPLYFDYTKVGLYLNSK